MDNGAALSTGRALRQRLQVHGGIMSNYRRARVPGATYFFTVNLRDRTNDLLIREIDLYRAP
ncbi:hypothetical protein GCM10017624_38270 [Azotobacter vinelandii]|nr:hypothetical protein GCM10017624_38270 [Azotobacter vinelandii]